MPRSPVLYDGGGGGGGAGGGGGGGGGCADYLHTAVLNELTDAEWTILLSRWLHSTAVLEKKEFRNCSVLYGWTTKHLSLFLM